MMSTAWPSKLKKGSHFYVINKWIKNHLNSLLGIFLNRLENSILSYLSLQTELLYVTKPRNTRNIPKCPFFITSSP